ncbi:MAG: TonB family protein [Alphaproteobacteria bacterium]
MKSSGVWPFGASNRPTTATPDTAQPSPTDANRAMETGGADAAANAASSTAKDSTKEAAAPPPAEPKRSQLVADIQTELKRLELYSGPIDGIDAAPVRNALAAARSKYGIPGPAFASRRLLNRLRNQLIQEPLPVTATAPPPAQAAEPAPAPPVQPARPKKVAATVYPRGALGREIQGWVDVTFDIDAEGDVQNARVTASENARAATYFSDPALKAIRATSFYPALEGNKPVWSRGVVRRFVFTLEQNR